VADGQYATLGMMLVGMLARIRTIVLPMGKEHSEAVEDGEGEEVSAGLQELDFGEVIMREDAEKISGVNSRVVDGDNEEEKDVKLKNLKSKKRRKETMDSKKVEPSDSELTSRQRRKKRRKDVGVL